jgi:hypothetical protein
MVVAGIRVVNVPDRKLQVLVLECPSGLRCDFALSLKRSIGSDVPYPKPSLKNGGKTGRPR